jgi:hypothetical protein
MSDRTPTPTTTTDAAEKRHIMMDMERMMAEMWMEGTKRKASEAYAQEQEQQVEETTKAIEQPTTVTADTPQPDLVDRMRRLSTDSDLSSYSIISGAPSLHSLDTDGSVTDGVTVASAVAEEPETVEQSPAVSEQTATATPHPLVPLPLQFPQTPEQALQALAYRPAATQRSQCTSLLVSPEKARAPEEDISATAKDSPRPLATIPAPGVPRRTSAVAHHDMTPAPILPSFVDLSDANIASYRPSPTANTQSSVPAVSHFWLQFPKFVPVPRASFKREFTRLAKEQSWNAKTQRKRQIEALTAEFELHYGTCMTNLDRWQQLCKDVGTKKMPASITQCKKVGAKDLRV